MKIRITTNFTLDGDSWILNTALNENVLNDLVTRSIFELVRDLKKMNGFSSTWNVNSELKHVHAEEIKDGGLT